MYQYLAARPPVSLTGVRTLVIVLLDPLINNNSKGRSAVLYGPYVSLVLITGPHCTKYVNYITHCDYQNFRPMGVFGFLATGNELSDNATKAIKTAPASPLQIKSNDHMAKQQTLLCALKVLPR